MLERMLVGVICVYVGPQNLTPLLKLACVRLQNLLAQRGRIGRTMVEVPVAGPEGYPLLARYTLSDSR